jgi:hypothetical protein
MTSKEAYQGLHDETLESEPSITPREVNQVLQYPDDHLMSYDDDKHRICTIVFRSSCKRGTTCFACFPQQRMLRGSRSFF